MTEYIRRIRILVGSSELLQLPSASVVVRDDEGRVMLAHHMESDRWLFPGGLIEPGETPADAAVRETWEETGLFVRLTRLVGVFGGAGLAQLFEANDDQKRRYLEPMLRGEKRGFFGLTEPSGGSDPARAIRTRAVRDGDDWIINGSKTFITNGGSADLVLVAARTSPEKKAKGISLFAVDTRLEGFSVGRVLDKVGQVESDTAELAFEDVRVSNDDLVGPLDTGFISMMQFLPQERLGSAITNLAHAKQILLETIQYAKDRRAFGQPIGTFQNTQFLLADLVNRIDVTQAFVDQCVVAHTKKELTPVDAAKAKWWTSQVQNDVLDHCVQVHGGYGYMNEYRVARAWRDARVTKIWAGSNEIMKMLIGRDLGL